jgi:hypothetical protein
VNQRSEIEENKAKCLFLRKRNVNFKEYQRRGGEVKDCGSGFSVKFRAADAFDLCEKAD